MLADTNTPSLNLSRHNPPMHTYTNTAFPSTAHTHIPPTQLQYTDRNTIVRYMHVEALYSELGASSKLCSLIYLAHTSFHPFIQQCPLFPSLILSFSPQLSWFGHSCFKSLSGSNKLCISHTEGPRLFTVWNQVFQWRTSQYRDGVYVCVWASREHLCVWKKSIALFVLPIFSHNHQIHWLCMSVNKCVCSVDSPVWAERIRPGPGVTHLITLSPPIHLSPFPPPSFSRLPACYR